MSAITFDLTHECQRRILFGSLPKGAITRTPDMPSGAFKIHYNGVNLHATKEGFLLELLYDEVPMATAHRCYVDPRVMETAHYIANHMPSGSLEFSLSFL